MNVTIRPATAADSGFLTEMLVAAALWREDDPTGKAPSVLARPELAHYVTGWPRADDLGVVAEDGAVSVGAAWLRYLSKSDPGYGFVDEGTPELTIGVARGYRGRRVGARLLDSLLNSAVAQGIEAVSLSVELDNYALRLYQRAGFEEVGVTGGAATMLRRL